MAVHRVLDRSPITSLDDHRAVGGLRALDAARRVEPSAVVDTVRAAVLRGRGGAGFPAGVKWQTVRDRATASDIAPTVVVNAAEGEPGSFGDRTIMRTNPFRVLEGALIAAHAVGAKSIVVGMKSSFEREQRALSAAADELEQAEMTDGVNIEIVGGPDHYLLGEETALLEAIAGRPPFPRLAPPFRHGTVEVGDPSGGAASLELAGETEAPPTLVNNVETLAHVPGIVEHGADWFRELGVPESPGTTVFTVSGDVLHAGTAELPLGTPVGEVIETIAGGPSAGEIAFVMSGISSGVLTAEQLDTPATHDGMAAAGGGLGTGGFLVFSTETDPVAVAHGVSRFLAVESCGQCTPCKFSGLDVAEELERLRDGATTDDAVERIMPLLHQVPVGARCDLGPQHERIVSSLLASFPEISVSHAVDGISADPVLIAPIVDIQDGEAILDETQADKQPDWEHGDSWSGETPADRHDVAVSIS